MIVAVVIGVLAFVLLLLIILIGIIVRSVSLFTVCPLHFQTLILPLLGGGEGGVCVNVHKCKSRFSCKSAFENRTPFP